VSSVAPGRSTTSTPRRPTTTGKAAAQAHALAQDGDGEEGDEQGLREGQGIDLRERQHREGVEGRKPAEERGARAQRDPPGMDGAQRPGWGSRIIIPMASGKEKSVEKKMSWKGEKSSPKSFTTASCVA
jgi:hypothetical protein